MQRKKKVLFLNEASFLSTGYAVYGREILKRLFNTGKYEIAELGCYGHVAPLHSEMEAFINLNGIPRMFDIPWTYYGNLPSESEEESAIYNSNLTNQYGEWRFEETCLDFKPDIVCDFRDFWMHEYVHRSPFRNIFKFAVMPTVDSAPLQEQWLNVYMNADAVLAYSEFGEKTLKEGTNNHINFKGIASPAADPKKFFPAKNKLEHKSKMGFDDDTKIVGTVMRNQGRKLYPDLFHAFSKVNQKNTFLYCHTCFPDIGWDIPYFLKYYNIANKVLFTYKCYNCGLILPSFFSDSSKVCPRCQTLSCKMPNTHNGVSDEELSAIYNCFDLYLQFSNCEGFGMPQCEAAFCGVPVASVNYSAMESFLNNVDGFRIPISRYFWDNGTNALRALPDIEYTTELIKELMNRPSFALQKAGFTQRAAALKRYSYDDSAKVWENYLDEAPLSNWESRKTLMSEPDLTPPPKNLTNEEFVNFCIVNILKEPQRVNSYEAMKWLRDLNYGECVKGTSEIIFNECSFITSNQRLQRFNRQDFVENLIRITEKRNYFEGMRLGLINKQKPYWIIRKKP